MRNTHEDEAARVAPLDVAGARQDLPRSDHGAIPTDAELDALATADMGIADLLLEGARLRVVNRDLVAAIRAFLNAPEGYDSWYTAAQLASLDLMRAAIAKAEAPAVSGPPPTTNAVDPHAQPSGTPSPRDKGIS